MCGQPSSLITRARIYANAASHEIKSQVSEREYPGLQSSVRRASEARFERIFSNIVADTIFVHAGLGDIKDAFDRNPYRYLRNVLDDQFESILVPGFTPSFRESGIYHKRYSHPQFGSFARQFLHDADYRTNDAIHSILVKGSYRFDDCTHHNSFGPESCWAKLDSDDILYCNIGTPWIVSTQHHFIEHEANVPYNNPTTYRGVIYYDDCEFEPWTQRNYSYTIRAMRNAQKIEKELHRQDILESHNLGGLRINLFRAQKMREALIPKISADPYYLIT